MSLRELIRHRHAPAALVIGVALLVRVLVLLEGRDAPTFLVPVVDARSYDLAARSLAAGQGFDYRFFWQPFFYPTVLGAIYQVTGASILAAKVLQLLLGVATSWMTLRVGRRLAGPAAGLVAGLICALHGPMIFFETELLATGWACFWAIFLLDRLTVARPDGALRDWGLIGLLTALAVLTRPTFLPALGIALVFVLWGSARRQWLPRLGLAAVGFALLVAPVALLGSQVTGSTGFLPASGAMNLYLGNNHEPCETLTIRPGEAWAELTRQARPQTAGDLRANRTYFRARLADELGSHPAAVARGLVRKGVQVMSSRELPRNVDPYFQRDYSPLLSVLMFRIGGFGFPMGLLLPLAVWGTWSARRRFPPVFFAFVATYLAAVVLVFVSARYRMPMVPAIAILAATGSISLVRAVREGRRRELVAAAACIGLVVALATVPGPFCEEQVDYRAETLYAVGYSLHTSGDLDDAAHWYGEALRSRPRYPELLNQFGLLRSHQDRWAEAIALWSQAVRLDPDDRAAHLNLARGLAHENRYDEALAQYAEVLRRDPDEPDALLGSGMALLGAARFEEGVARLERALELRPDFAARMQPVIDALVARGREDLAARLRVRSPR